MHKMRFISLLFLVWAIAFFFLPEFRQGIELSFVSREWPWLIRAGTLDPQKLEKYARLGEQQRDAKTLAFAALHSRNKDERVRWASQAVALDPQLTWIYHTLVMQSPNDPQVDQWISRLKTWDPENAVPYLLEAQRAIDRARKWVQPSNLDELAKETDWRQAMAKAFTAPRYDSYARRRFELERTWLHQNRLDHPATVLVSVMSYPVPRWLNIHMYGELLLKKLGPDAERSNHVPEAIRYYWMVAHFGERMQLEEPVLLERMTGAALQLGAYDRLLPLLKKKGQTEETATVEYAEAQVRQRLDLLNGRDPLAQSSNYNWSALTVHISAGLVVVFGLASVFCMIYMGARMWRRPDKHEGFYRFVMMTQNYVLILFFLSCVGLYLTYYPYGRNFEHYMSASGEIQDFEPLFFNVLPAFGIVPGRLLLPVNTPFRPYVWYAASGLAIVLIASKIFERAPSSPKPPEKRV